MRNSIRAWALVAVAVTSGALIAFAAWLIDLLSGPDWCGRAIGAERASGKPRSQESVDGCLSLMHEQVHALALNSHLAIGTIALSLLVLVVIVLAGGKLSFTANKDGVSGDIGRDAAAREVADAAGAKADEIEEEAR